MWVYTRGNSRGYSSAFVSLLEIEHCGLTLQEMVEFKEAAVAEDLRPTETEADFLRRAPDGTTSPEGWMNDPNSLPWRITVLEAERDALKEQLRCLDEGLRRHGWSAADALREMRELTALREIMQKLGGIEGLREYMR